MFQEKELSQILFIDIETVSATRQLSDLPPGLQGMWLLEAEKERARLAVEELAADAYFLQKAALHAEFGKVVCISAGFIHEQAGSEPELRIKSFFGDDEVQLLQEFKHLLNTRKNRFKILCAHNGKEFDFPFLCRRYLINGITLPDLLVTRNKKPWELHHLADTMDFWKFASRNSSRSLALLCQAFGIPTSKDDINGSEVTNVYWQEADLPRIVTYCEKDIVALAQVALRLSCLPLLKQEHISVPRYVTAAHAPASSAPMALS
jgi:3'-5' exonuclease